MNGMKIEMVLSVYKNRVHTEATYLRFTNTRLPRQGSVWSYPPDRIARSHPAKTDATPFARPNLAGRVPHPPQAVSCLLSTVYCLLCSVYCHIWQPDTRSVWPDCHYDNFVFLIPHNDLRPVCQNVVHTGPVPGVARVFSSDSVNWFAARDVYRRWDIFLYRFNNVDNNFTYFIDIWRTLIS